MQNKCKKIYQNHSKNFYELKMQEETIFIIFIYNEIIETEKRIINRKDIAAILSTIS